MENKHLIAIGAFGLLILLMVLLVFQSNKLPKMGEDLTGLNLGAKGVTPTPVPLTELTGRDLNVGTSSAAVVAGDTVTIHYRGAFMDGKIFDDSYQKNSPITFQVGAGQIIKGVELGVVGMKTGGKRQIGIPSDLAYGTTGSGPIPPNTPLIFEIELLDFKSQTAALSPDPQVSVDPTTSPAESSTPAP